MCSQSWTKRGLSRRPLGCLLVLHGRLKAGAAVSPLPPSVSTSLGAARRAGAGGVALISLSCLSAVCVCECVSECEQEIASGEGRWKRFLFFFLRMSSTCAGAGVAMCEVHSTRSGFVGVRCWKRAGPQCGTCTRVQVDFWGVTDDCRDASTEWQGAVWT